MVERASALEGHNEIRRFGRVEATGPGIRLTERPILSAWLMAAWPETLAACGKAAAAAAGVEAAPGPGESATGKGGTLLRTEPLKWLLISDAEVGAPKLAEKDGTVLELGHARTVIHVSGPKAVDLMARMVPIDLRPSKFPEGSVATSPLHHIAVTILARDGGFDILVIRSFGLAVWEALIDTAAQFGGEIV